ncbi:NERD domain-containing protein [Amphibacillus cookii]|uniref:NERD domain-containing protein n=1 Tax=Amphibacillus cookii TaxID=767787 RepID=UPI0019565FC5|nr:NERD domain-containing protein [Amphibacillus cookii]MBM7542978.1 hypothetical protein [Amphibacillus cookii]
MGQLIKLENYISRYQRDILHYPRQFIRLKQDNWKRLLDLWHNQPNINRIEAPLEEKNQTAIFDKIMGMFNKREVIEEQPIDSLPPQNEEQLKQYFLDSLYHFQLNWSSTTLHEMSFLDRSYQEDLTLKYFLQRFPDSFLFMYQPVFKLKNATVDADIIMITPFEVNIIKLVEYPSSRTVIAGDDRTWFIEENHVRSKMLSPMLSVKRSDKIVKSILNHQGLDIPIHKIILSRTNIIDFDLEPFQTTYVDKEAHEEWLQKQRAYTSPLKHQQLKVADALLAYSDTVAVNRPEWEQVEDDEF